MTLYESTSFKLTARMKPRILPMRAIELDKSRSPASPERSKKLTIKGSAAHCAHVRLMPEPVGRWRTLFSSLKAWSFVRKIFPLAG